ncbi:MAG: hypothetical protein LUC93_03275 [Planctomycetaceae bacterium]|nr:hypothetical protein [Planctomycetaceae bacterium]
MKLRNRAFGYDYYNEDLDLSPSIVKPLRRRSKARASVKRLASKVRRQEIAGEIRREIIKMEGE